MIAQIEADLSREFHPARVLICLDPRGSDTAGQGVALRIDGAEIGKVHVVAPEDSLVSKVEDVLRLIAAPLAAAIAYRRRPERRFPAAQGQISMRFAAYRIGAALTSTCRPRASARG